MPDLVALSHHQWSLPVLVELLRGPEKRPAAVARRLNVSRQTLTDTLRSLADLGLVAAGETPSLTRKGERAAERSEALLAALGKVDAAGQRKWALPILLALGKKAQRFGELKAALPGATPRALSMSLKDLTSAGLVDRRVLDGFPPRTEYVLSAKSRALPPLLEQLARS